MSQGGNAVVTEAARSGAQGVVLGGLSGALSLGLDALVTHPHSVLLSVALGVACGALIGILLGVARFVTERLPAWLALCVWAVGGAGLGFVAAVGIGALENLRGQQQVLALLTLGTACVGGLCLGAALAVVQSAKLRQRMSAKLAWLPLAIGVASALLCLAVAAAPELARWLLVYPLAMKLSVGAAFVFAYCALAGASVRLAPPSRRLAAGGLGLALLVLLGLGVAPSTTLSPLLATQQGAQLLVQLRALSDRDADGVSGFFGGGDCAPGNPKVHPRAREIPGNGIDDNCMLGDAKPVARTARVSPEAASGPSPVSVVLITIDALRADHTQPYGYGQPTTPNLAKFARDARRYERAFTAGGRTGLGLVSLIGGAQVREQRWQLVPRVLPDRPAARSPWDVVPHGWALEPIPGVLRRRGMRTASVLHFGAASWFTAGDTFGPLFDELIVAPDRDALPDTETVDAALRVLGKMGDAPFFLWVHLYGPHEPHLKPPAGAPNFGSGIVASYDSDVWQTDQELGRLLAGIDAVGGPPRVIAITADHSEEFAGDRTFHAVDMFGESTRIPLLVRGPGVAPGVDDRIVSAIDLAPSIMSWTQTSAHYPGFSLAGPSSRDMALCDTFRPSRRGGLNMEQVVATDGRHRYVVDFETGREEFSDEPQASAKSGAAGLAFDVLKSRTLAYVEAHGPPSTVVMSLDGKRKPPYVTTLDAQHASP